MKVFAVFDIGGSSVKHALVNEQGEIQEKGKFGVAAAWDGFISDIIKTIKGYMSVSEISGVAISAPGAVDSRTGIIGGSSAIPYIHGPNFKEYIYEATGLPVEIENDANCAALAEVWRGAAKNVSNSAFFVCGTGVGGAIVKNRKVHHGANLHGGEFGYIVLDNIGGVPQTLSDLGATGALIKNIAARKNMAEKSLDGVKVFALAAAGDVICREEINKFYYYLALGLYNIQYTYDPELIVLGGAISEREGIIERLEEKMDEILEAIPAAKIRPRILKCEFCNDANLVGALYHYLTWAQ